MQHKSGVNNERQPLDSGEMYEGNQFSVSNLVTNLLNWGCQHPHCHDGVDKFLPYITGEQFQHIPKTNAIENISLPWIQRDIRALRLINKQITTL